jgi:hypothetical protein
MKRKEDASLPMCTLENPQVPETLDASTPNIDVSSFTGLMFEGIDAQDVLYIDPDRPPISTSDKRKM